MALSTFIDFFGIDWPLGFIAVANNGTPVNIMSRVDSANNWAPGSLNSEYTVAAHQIRFQALKPGTSNNGMIINTGFVYVLRALGPGNNNSGGPQTRADSGAMVAVLRPGEIVVLPAIETVSATVCPYRYTVDSDVDGEGALVTLLNCARG